MAKNDVKLNSAWQYCTAKVMNSGSDWYYALLKTTPDVKQATLALLTLEADWHAIHAKCAEPSLAAIQFAWWHNELNLAFDGQATHPALQLLQPVIKTFHLQHKLLEAMLNQAEQATHSYRFDHFSDLQRAAYSGIDALFILGLYVFGAAHAKLSEALHPLTFSLTLMHALHHLPATLRRGIMPFALDDLQSVNLTIEAPDSWSAAALSTLAARYHQQALTLYQQACVDFSASEKKQLRPLLCYAKLQFKRAELLQEANYPLLTHSITLTPLRKLLLTWFL